MARRLRISVRRTWRSNRLLFYSALVGVFGGIFYRIRDRFRQLHVPNHIIPAIGGLLMGLLAMAFPQSTSTGYGWVQMTMTSGYVGHILIVLVFVKILAMSLTISSGGVFGPNVYFGAMLGGWVAFVMDKWIPAAHFTPAAFAVVGMGAVFAGTARVPTRTGTSRRSLGKQLQVRPRRDLLIARYGEKKFL